VLVVSPPTEEVGVNVAADEAELIVIVDRGPVGLVTGVIEVVGPPVIEEIKQEHAEETAYGDPAQFSRYVGIALGAVITAVV
jgi:hypothetical protein